MKRKAFLRLRERYRRRGKTFIYADECGFERQVTRCYARAPRGQKVHGLRSGQKRPRTSLIAARVESGDFIAPFLFPGTCDTDTFNLWLKDYLCPLLNENHVVVIDNAAFHKSDETCERVAATGATILFLPPYSPDLNPIEHDFASIKKTREFNENETLDNIIKMYN